MSMCYIFMCYKSVITDILVKIPFWTLCFSCRRQKWADDQTGGSLGLWIIHHVEKCVLLLWVFFFKCATVTLENVPLLSFLSCVIFWILRALYTWERCHYLAKAAEQEFKTYTCSQLVPLLTINDFYNDLHWSKMWFFFSVLLVSALFFTVQSK